MHPTRPYSSYVDHNWRCLRSRRSQLHPSEQQLLSRRTGGPSMAWSSVTCIACHHVPILNWNTFDIMVLRSSILQSTWRLTLCIAARIRCPHYYFHLFTGIYTERERTRVGGLTYCPPVVASCKTCWRSVNQNLPSRANISIHLI